MRMIEFGIKAEQGLTNFTWTSNSTQNEKIPIVNYFPKVVEKN